jgi:DNA-directed RNA polymerase specialized sigma24 family protein
MILDACVAVKHRGESQLDNYPFSTFYQVIGFYLFNNPARQRSINLLETDRNTPYTLDWLDEGHPNYRWAIIAQELNKTLKDYPHEQRQAFIDRYLRPSEQCLAAEDIAIAIGKSPRVVYYWISKIRTDLEIRFAQRGLMPIPVRLQN